MIRYKIKNLIIDCKDHYNLLNKSEIKNIQTINQSILHFESDIRDGFINCGDSTFFRINSNVFLFIIASNDSINFVSYNTKSDHFSEHITQEDAKFLSNSFLIGKFETSNKRMSPVNELGNILKINMKQMISDIRHERADDSYRQYTKEYNLDVFSCVNINDPGDDDISNDTDDIDISDDR